MTDPTMTRLRELLAKVNPCNTKAAPWIDSYIVLIGSTPDGEHFAELVTPAEVAALRLAYPKKFKEM